jgi:hypothetical protein
MISMSGPLDWAGAAMVATYLLDQADVASGDFYLDLRAVDLVDGADIALITALRRRLTVRGHQLHVNPPDPTRRAAGWRGIRPVPQSGTRGSRCPAHRPAKADGRR